MVVDGTSIVAEVKSSWAVMRKSDVTALGDIAKKIRPDVALLAVMDTGKKHREALEALGSELREAGIKLQVMTLDTNPLNDDPYQIGRESCRERVCQYVKISVVAVTLTKNINTVRVNEVNSIYKIII